jgi:hypothetical protein
LKKKKKKNESIPEKQGSQFSRPEKTKDRKI